MACSITETCLKYSCNNQRPIYDGAIYTPYVKMIFAGGQVITIGNNSAPNINLAAISSFTYGFQANGMGWGCDIEIIDNGGAVYRKLLRAINKTTSRILEEMDDCKIDFGWMVTDSDGNTIPILCSTVAGISITGFFAGLDATFESGSVKIKLSVRAPQSKVYDTSHTGSMAGTDKPISLREALKKLFTEYSPKWKKVIFRRADGSENGFEFKENPPDGPLSTWPLNQQNSLSVARQWLTGVVTKEGYGCIIVYDNKRNAVIIQEDQLSGKNSDELCQTDRVLATYIVNGGNCSQVISFTPSVSFIKGMIPGEGGTTGGASSGDNSQKVKPNKDIANIEDAGTQTNIVVQEHEWNFRSPNGHASLAREAEVANMHAANAVGDGAAPKGFKAELKIHGDPFFSNYDVCGAKCLSIVFINPYYIANSESGCSWLQTSTCNSMLSNREYLITGVSHQIQNGSYTTTFELSLAIPQVDIDFDMPLGGPSGTERFVDGEGNMGVATPTKDN